MKRGQLLVGFVIQEEEMDLFLKIILNGVVFPHAKLRRE